MEETRLKELSAFFEQHRLPHRCCGVLATGSEARGYATQESDVDLMAFYETRGNFVADSTFARSNGKVTLEHHDLDEFLDEVLDHRYNIASLRMLWKVRDGIPVVASSGLDALMQVARRAHLDRSALLWALKELASEWNRLSELEAPVAREHMLRWSEFLLTLELLCTAGGPAYSKPKWLYRHLRDGGYREGLELLDALYQPTAERIQGMATALQKISANAPVSSLRPANQGFFEVAANDIPVATKRFPSEAGPVIRFVATSYYRLLYGEDPLNVLTSAGAFADPSFEAIFERRLPLGYDHSQASKLFKSYVRALSVRIVREYRAKWTGIIGSRFFVAYLLGNYGAFDLFPPAYKCLPVFPSVNNDSVEAWLTTVEDWSQILD